MKQQKVDGKGISYQRPLFLAPGTLPSALDHKERPIISSEPKSNTTESNPQKKKEKKGSYDSAALEPLQIVGYAEMVNGGKSELNEDQAICIEHFIPSQVQPASEKKEKKKNKKEKKGKEKGESDPTGVNDNEHILCGIFDGHGGHYCASHVVSIFPQILASRLRDVSLLLASTPKSEEENDNAMERLYTAALEASFIDTDEATLNVAAGCTALVALLTSLPSPSSKARMMLHVANAGDCRAILTCTTDQPESKTDETPEAGIIEMSTDHSPLHPLEIKRIQNVVLHNPSLLGSFFRRHIFVNPSAEDRSTIAQVHVTPNDVGKRIPCIDAHLSAPVMREVTPTDAELTPLVLGDSKSAKLMGKLGTTRGFGDHALAVLGSPIKVKPLLTAAPEVRTRVLRAEEHDQYDVIVMGCDGLWDVIDNHTAGVSARAALKKHLTGEGGVSVGVAAARAASELVQLAKDRRSGDDVTAIVIPIGWLLLHPNK